MRTVKPKTEQNVVVLDFCYSDSDENSEGEESGIPVLEAVSESGDRAEREEEDDE